MAGRDQGGVVLIPWYATLFRQDSFAVAVGEAAKTSLKYGATKYSVLVSRDDRYKISQYVWFSSKVDWYRYWEGPEMIEFRARHVGHFQIPVVYSWQDEVAAGELGPDVPLSDAAPAPEPAPTPAIPA